MIDVLFLDKNGDSAENLSLIKTKINKKVYQQYIVVVTENNFK